MQKLCDFKLPENFSAAISEMGDRLLRAETLLSEELAAKQALQSKLDMVLKQKSDAEKKLAQMKLRLEYAKALGKIEGKIEAIEAPNAVKRELYTYCVKSYIAGFNHCKEMVRRKYPELDLSDINIDDYDVDEGETSSEEDEVTDEEGMDEDHPIE